MSDSTKGVARAAGAMGVATLLSRVFGLVREQAFAILFGAGNATDAFNIAFRIPNLLRDLFAEGALSAALVPTFTQERVIGGERRGWRAATLVFVVLTGVVSALAVAGLIFAPDLVGVYAGAFRSVAGKFELTVTLTRIMIPFFPLIALSAAVMGILNALGVFFIPAFSSALFNIVSVACGVALTFVCRALGREPIEGMAYGVVLGGIAQVVSQIPSLRSRGFRWQRRDPGDPSWHADPALRRMLLLMIPGTVGLAATQVNILVNSVLATGEGTGAVSWLNYAFRLMQFPIGVFGVSLASATLPRISTQWAAGDRPAFASTLTSSLRQVAAVNLPASVGLAVLGGPIISLIFQYGAFTENHARHTAIALAAYSVGLTAYSGVKVLVPAFYAMGESRIPVQSSLFSVALNIGLNIVTVREFGYWGLALGTSVTAIVNSMILLFAMRRRLGADGFKLYPLAVFSFRALALAIAMGAFCWGTHELIAELAPGLGLFWLVRLLRVLVPIGFGGGLVFALARAFGVHELASFAEYVASRVKKRLGLGT